MIKLVVLQAVVHLWTFNLTRNVLTKIKPIHKAEVFSDLKAVLYPANPLYTPKHGITKSEYYIDKWYKNISFIENI